MSTDGLATALVLTSSDWTFVTNVRDTLCDVLVHYYDISWPWFPSTRRLSGGLPNMNTQTTDNNSKGAMGASRETLLSPFPGQNGNQGFVCPAVVEGFSDNEDDESSFSDNGIAWWWHSSSKLQVPIRGDWRQFLTTKKQPSQAKTLALVTERVPMM